MKANDMIGKTGLMRQVVVVALLAGMPAAPALAQVPGITNPVPPVPQPPPPPPPSMAVPQVPKMDAPTPPRVEGRRSYNERFADCLSDATAAGLGHAERAMYSRACAQRS